MKRLLAFLVLLAIGIAALRLSIGGDLAGANGTARTTEPKAPIAPTSPGISVQQGRLGATVSQSGRLDLPKWRHRPMADGTTEREPEFWLYADDSRPLADGLQQLDTVRVHLFDAGKHAATLNARQAFVELQRDANGQPSLAKAKTIDLRDCVFTTEPGSRLSGLRIELGNCKVTVGDVEVTLTTAPDQPVVMSLEGERQGTLRGVGAQARLPRDARGELRQAYVELLREPVLETDGLSVRAKGRLRYAEDTATGAAQLSLDDDVVLDLTRGDLALFGQPPKGGRSLGGTNAAQARGDQFWAWLTRARDRHASTERPAALAWQRLLLTGAPAIVEIAGSRVQTPRVSVLPGLSGEPAIVTVHGGESRFEVRAAASTAAAEPADPIIAIAQRRTHLILPGEHVGSIHRAYGFPRWAMRSFDRLQLTVCEGRARLEGQNAVTASDGLWVLRSGDERTGAVRGFGAVEYTKRATRAGDSDLTAAGNDGFLLTVTPHEERLRLGPADSTAARLAAHRYDLRYGTARAEGTGGCLLTQRGEQQTLSLLAAGPEIAVHLPADGLDLTGVASLDAVLDGPELRSLRAIGLPATAKLLRKDETLTATAALLVLIGPRSLRLLPAPDTAQAAAWPKLAANLGMPMVRRQAVRSGEQVEMRGPQIDLHHAGGHDVIVVAEAIGGDLPHAYARVPQPNGVEDTTIACTARVLRFLPFVLTPEVQHAHFGSAHSALAAAAAHALGQPWLIVDEVVDFQLDDARHGHCEGRGHRVLVSRGGAAALFVGNADLGTPAEVRRSRGDREVATAGARVRIFRDADLRLEALASFADRSTLLAPTMTLHEHKQHGLLSHMQASCRGNIEVLSESVVFGGPVAAFAIRPDGSEDPDGIRIDARELRLKRLASSGEIVRAIGKDMHVDWARLDARAEEVELDLVRKRCTVRDANDATVALPDGRTLWAPFLEVNYETLDVLGYRVRAAKLDGER